MTAELDSLITSPSEVRYKLTLTPSSLACADTELHLSGGLIVVVDDIIGGGDILPCDSALFSRLHFENLRVWTVGNSSHPIPKKL